MTLNRFLFGTVIRAIFDNIVLCSFLSLLCYPCQSPRFVPVIVLLSPTVTLVSAFLRFVMFSSEFTICDVAPESAINVSLSCPWFDFFVINSSSYITSSVTYFADSFSVFFFLWQSFS